MEESLPVGAKLVEEPAEELGHVAEVGGLAPEAQVEHAVLEHAARALPKPEVGAPARVVGGELRVHLAHGVKLTYKPAAHGVADQRVQVLALSVHRGLLQAQRPRHRPSHLTERRDLAAARHALGDSPRDDPPRADAARPRAVPVRRLYVELPLQLGLKCQLLLLGPHAQPRRVAVAGRAAVQPRAADSADSAAAAAAASIRRRSKGALEPWLDRAA